MKLHLITFKFPSCIYNYCVRLTLSLFVSDPQPSVSLKIRPNRTQHFTSKSLSLSCEEKRNSTGWRLKRYREKAVESECGSNWGSRAGSTCTIRSTYTGDSGVYWCESGSGEYSNAVNITVDGTSVVQQSLMFFTLQCLIMMFNSVTEWLHLIKYKLMWVITPDLQYYLYIMLYSWQSDPGEPSLSHN